MARLKIPGVLDRRHLLERDLDPAQALRYADAYIEEERLVEAVDFLAKAGADDRLGELADRAVEEGDAFLLKLISAALAEEPGTDRWKRLAEAAERGGLDEYAEAARRLAGVSEG